MYIRVLPLLAPCQPCQAPLRTCPQLECGPRSARMRCCCPCGSQSPPARTPLAHPALHQNRDAQPRVSARAEWSSTLRQRRQRALVKIMQHPSWTASAVSLCAPAQEQDTLSRQDRTAFPVKEQRSSCCDFHQGPSPSPPPHPHTHPQPQKTHIHTPSGAAAAGGAAGVSSGRGSSAWLNSQSTARSMLPPHACDAE